MPAAVPARLILRELTPLDAQQAWEAHRELEAEGFPFLLGPVDGEPWARSLDRIARERAGVGLAEGWVAATFLVAELGGTIVGRGSVRHSLTPRLALSGGHIGYAVRPAWRRRGLATAMLREALGIAASVGVTEALLTCDTSNLASAAVIERCGGRLQGRRAAAREWRTEAAIPRRDDGSTARSGLTTAGRSRAPPAVRDGARSPVGGSAV